jgi:hypothetical protein
MASEKIERFFCNDCKGKTKHFVRGEFVKIDQHECDPVSFAERLLIEDFRPAWKGSGHFFISCLILATRSATALSEGECILSWSWPVPHPLKN